MLGLSGFPRPPCGVEVVGFNRFSPPCGVEVVPAPPLWCGGGGVQSILGPPCGVEVLGLGGFPRPPCGVEVVGFNRFPPCGMEVVGGVRGLRAPCLESLVVN